MTNTRPVISSLSPIGEARDSSGKILAKVFAISPFTQFLQQFVQKAPTIIDISALSPYTANQLGTIIVTTGGTVKLIRGSISITLLDTQPIIPISIGDTVSWTSGAAVVKFLGS